MTEKIEKTMKRSEIPPSHRECKAQGTDKFDKVRKQIDPNNITEYGIRIVMDEEKILREDKYDLDKIYQAIDEIAQFAKMKKIDKYYYVSINDTPSALGCFTWSNLQKLDWFMDNVKEWLWLDKLEGITDILKLIEEDDINVS